MEVVFDCICRPKVPDLCLAAEGVDLLLASRTNYLRCLPFGTIVGAGNAYHIGVSAISARQGEGLDKSRCLRKDIII